MTREKMVYVSEKTHRALKLLSARQNRPMGKLVDELVEQELAELANLWTAPEGLRLQEQVLAEAWDDPVLDVYNDD